MKVTENNSIIYITDPDITFDWCESEWNISKSAYVNWFHLNGYTRMFFKKDVLPYIKSGQCHITKELYDKIRKFSQNQENDKPLEITEIPDGIELMDHQVTALDYMSKYNKFAFFLGTGTGKTLIAITWLMNAKPKSVLVVTPKKVIPQYRKELKKYIGDTSHISVTNYEQLNHELYINSQRQYEAVIFDESHKLKSVSSNMSQEAREICKHAKYVYMFTGTPQDKSRHEILAQLSILDTRVIPDRAKTKVFERFFRIDDYYEPRSEIRKRKPELDYIISKYTWGKKSEDAITLPNVYDHVIKIEHPSKYYDELERDRVVYSDTDSDYACVADTSGKLRIALREVASGCLNFTDSRCRMITESFGGKADALKSTASQVGNGIIYYEFTASLKEIIESLEQINKTYVIVNGSTTTSQTEERVGMFKEGKVDFLVIQSVSGNAGLDLTNVNSVIYYALPESYIVYHQSKGRICRVGQKKDCHYYYLISERTIEELIYQQLKKKKSLTDKVFRQYI